MTMPDDADRIEVLPAPRSAITHVAQGESVLPRGYENLDPNPSTPAR